MSSIGRKIQSAFQRGWQILTLLIEPETRTRIGIAAERYQTTRAAVVRRLVELFLAKRFYPLESLANGLANPGKPFASHHEHFSREELHGLQTGVNTSDAAMCRDKLLFHAYCESYGLPVPRLYGVLSRYGSRDNHGNSLDLDDQLSHFVSSTLPESFIAKPRGGNKGRGILLIDNQASSPDQSDRDSIVAQLKGLARGREDYLLEHRLQIHPHIAQLTGTDAVSTVRVITFIPHGEKPQIMGAILRVIAHDSITDNISDFETGGFSGNLLASVDLQSGCVEWALTPNRDGVDREMIEHHPRTGEALAGFQVPLWGAVEQLCIRAASAFLPLRTIGWDVAITADGAILIEANELFQYSAFGAATTPMRQLMIAEVARQRAIAGLKPTS